MIVDGLYVIRWSDEDTDMCKCWCMVYLSIDGAMRTLICVDDGVC